MRRFGSVHELLVGRSLPYLELARTSGYAARTHGSLDGFACALAMETWHRSFIYECMQ